MDITYIYLLHDCIKNIKDCTHLVPCCHTLPVTLIIEIKNCIEHSRECFFTYNYTLMSCEILVPALRSTKSHLHDFKKDYARPTDENSCVDIHGKFCAWPSELLFILLSDDFHANMSVRCVTQNQNHGISRGKYKILHISRESRNNHSIHLNKINQITGSKTNDLFRKMPYTFNTTCSSSAVYYIASIITEICTCICTYVHKLIFCTCKKKR